jgi:hypothetical protein
MPRKTTKRKNIDSSIPLEAPQETTASEPVQPEETQVFIEKSREESISVDYNESEEVYERDPTPTTPVESAHTSPSPVPRGRQEDEESEQFGADFQESDRPRQRSFSEDEAETEAYFKKYGTTTFHPDDKTADKKIRVIYPLVTQPLASITVQTVPNLSAQERQSVTKVRDHRRDRYKARFWPACYVIPQSLESESD